MSFTKPSDHCPLEDDIDAAAHDFNAVLRDNLDEDNSPESAELIELKSIHNDLSTKGWSIYKKCFASDEVDEIKTAFFDTLVMPEQEANVYRGEEVINSSRSKASILTMTNQTLTDFFTQIYFLTEVEGNPLTSSITNMNYITEKGALPNKAAYKIFQNSPAADVRYIGLANFSETSRVTLYSNSQNSFGRLLLNIFNGKAASGSQPDVNTLNLLVEEGLIEPCNPMLLEGDVLLWDSRLTIKIEQENNCLSKYISYEPRKSGSNEAMFAKRSRYFHGCKTTRLVVNPVIVQAASVIKKYSICSSITLINDEDESNLSKLF